MTGTRRYVLLSKPGPACASDLDEIRKLEGVAVVDVTSNRALLVEASEEGLRRLQRLLPNWLISPERIHPLH